MFLDNYKLLNEKGRKQYTKLMLQDAKCKNCKFCSRTTWTANKWSGYSCTTKTGHNSMAVNPDDICLSWQAKEPVEAEVQKQFDKAKQQTRNYLEGRRKWK